MNLPPRCQSLYVLFRFCRLLLDLEMQVEVEMILELELVYCC